MAAIPGRKSPSVKKKDTYEALRDKGMSRQRAARISNAQAKKTGGNRKSSARKKG